MYIVICRFIIQSHRFCTWGLGWSTCKFLCIFALWLNHFRNYTNFSAFHVQRCILIHLKKKKLPMSLNTRTHFLNLLASGEIDRLLEELNEYWTQTRDADKINQVALISSQLNDLKRANRLHTILREQYITEYAQIKDAISELIQLLPDDARLRPPAKKTTRLWFFGAFIGLALISIAYYFIVKSTPIINPSDHNEPNTKIRTNKDTVETGKDTQKIYKPVKNSSKPMVFSGYVLDATEKTSIAGAKLQFSGIDLITKSDGYYKSGDLRKILNDASFLQISITAPGYRTRTENVYITDLDNKKFYLEPYEEIQH
ncbi:MAG: hypothetical protein WCR52_15085 [Bacteroidota bacterium]